ncbi:helix-turn-helix domain-containing protein [Kluyvera ascorbata]|jgi:HTH-type transcriptional regulator/antitoxin HigA|uniref:Transcriptional regulator n=1 Tax=Kluyvera ascorbata TaxID=51288 RepID=A0AB35XE67_9ENTR|nr:transcriptional regulator [Kluyvera ascorbata]BBV63626.1 transcriptional regulator [Klebsiella sp. STW0522-44]HEB4872264.1 transcriptional regulator [Kluyvera ascorbata F0526]MDT8699363.1 transcriptional regulator [Kluyvera ascorbata]MDU3914113.1 transcriptional regulator [Kluyvera ascorbata]MDZ4031898.1 transcriptional regulator [Kluyvera ascorbata]
MTIKPIKTEQDYKAALKAVEPYFDNEPAVDTPEGDYFEVMCLLIEEYEAKNHPIDPPEAIEAILFRMEQQGLTVKDLEPAIGKSNRVYEVLKGTRTLTLPMIRRLHKQFGIPLESLVGI